MSDDAPAKPTLALSTRLEEDFVSPLTAVRGALEILRDFPDLSAEDRARFVQTALGGCARLEAGVAHLGAAVYSAAQQRHLGRGPETDRPAGNVARRIRILDEHEAIEVDLSGLEFTSSREVNAFYDVLEKLVEGSGRSWYFVVNYRDCSVWPEAWVAFAHRGKRVNDRHSLGTVRYVQRDDRQAPSARSVGADDPDMFDSRDEALAHVADLRAGAGRV